LSLSPAISTFGELTSEVSKFTKVYEWSSAAELCETFIRTNGEDPRVYELLADYYYNAAFQQKTRDEFKKVILRAEEAYSCRA
jgi:hypothetical protein